MTFSNFVIVMLAFYGVPTLLIGILIFVMFYEVTRKEGD